MEQVFLVDIPPAVSYVLAAGSFALIVYILIVKPIVWIANVNSDREKFDRFMEKFEGLPQNVEALNKNYEALRHDVEGIKKLLMRDPD